jgi:release factor glutamine methyltransferase
MINSKDLFRDLRAQITLAEDAGELDSMVQLVLEDLIEVSSSDVLFGREISLSVQQQGLLQDAVKRINTGEPIQYISGKAHFYGCVFQVNPSVLIPRPETEELVREAIKQSDLRPGRILDIGTGSGCIAITLANHLPEKKVFAYDVSDAALAVATANAKSLSVQVAFKKVDILNDAIAEHDLDIIISNPPYVTVSEKASMKDNVLQHEPHVAFFVPDNDPLIFYKTIAEKGFAVLKPNGKIMVEINERFGNETANVFREKGFSDVRIIRDMQNKDRIVMAVKR